MPDTPWDTSDVAPVAPFCYFVGWPRVEVKLQLRSRKSLGCRVGSGVAPRFSKPLVGSSNLSPGTTLSADYSTDTGLRRRPDRDDRVAGRCDTENKKHRRSGVR